MTKVLTVTANTAIDHFITVKELKLGATLLAQSNFNYPAGKGINAAKALASLDCSVVAMGFVGEQSQPMFSRLHSDFMRVDLTVVAGQSRTNITLSDNELDTETHIRTTGFSVTQTDCDRLINNIDTTLEAGDILVLSGSLPNGAPQDLYSKMIEKVHEKGVITFLDSNGPGLQQGLKAKPHWLKPNLKELEEICGQPLKTAEEIIDAARNIVARGIQNIVISRGKEGVILVNDTLIIQAYVENVVEPVISQVGCGDALVAGLVYGLLQAGYREEKTILRFGLACATANLLSSEPGKLVEKKVIAISEHVKFNLILG